MSWKGCAASSAPEMTLSLNFFPGSNTAEFSPIPNPPVPRWITLIILEEVTVDHVSLESRSFLYGRRHYPRPLLLLHGHPSFMSHLTVRPSWELQRLICSSVGKSLYAAITKGIQRRSKLRDRSCWAFRQHYAPDPRASFHRLVSLGEHAEDDTVEIFGRQVSEPSSCLTCWCAFDSGRNESLHQNGKKERLCRCHRCIENFFASSLPASVPISHLCEFAVDGFGTSCEDVRGLVDQQVDGSLVAGSRQMMLDGAALPPKYRHPCPFLSGRCLCPSPEKLTF